MTNRMLPAGPHAVLADSDGTPPTPDREWRFPLGIFISALIHGVFIFLVVSVDISKLKPRPIEEMPQRIAKLIMNKPQKKEKAKIKEAAAKTAEKPAEAKPPEVQKAEAQVKERKTAQVNVAKRAQKVEQELRTTGMLALLTGVGPSKFKGRAAVDVMGGHSMRGVDLDAALKGVTGVSRAGAESDLEVKLTTRRVVESQEKLSIADMVQGFGKSDKALQKLGDIQVSKPKTVGAVPQSAKREENAIAAFVKKNMRSIEAEYNRLLKINPGLSGKITVRFTIQADGSVTDVVVVESTIDDEGLKSKITRVVTNWQFPPIDDSEGTLTVNFPFVFQPN